jgi:hypothetical protein
MKLPPILSAHPGQDTDYSIWPLAYCQADMPYDFFGGSGLYSNKGIVKIPKIYTLVVGGEVGGKQHVALVDCRRRIGRPPRTRRDTARGRGQQLGSSGGRRRRVQLQGNLGRDIAPGGPDPREGDAPSRLACPRGVILDRRAPPPPLMLAGAASLREPRPVLRTQRRPRQDRSYARLRCALPSRGTGK